MEKQELETLAEQTEKQASCSSLAIFLMRHIDEPCIEPITDQNIRDVYVRQAKILLQNPNFTNPYFKELLQQKISEYS